MHKYCRIEINAYRRRVTVVSGEASQRDLSADQPAETDDSVARHDTDGCEPIAPDSSEGQQTLVEAVRSLERSISVKGDTRICARQDALATNRSHLRRFYLRLQYFYRFIWPRPFRIPRREK